MFSNLAPSDAARRDEDPSPDPQRHRGVRTIVPPTCVRTSFSTPESPRKLTLGVRREHVPSLFTMVRMQFSWSTDTTIPNHGVQNGVRLLDGHRMTSLAPSIGNVSWSLRRYWPDNGFP
jgi:hypothetical protein